MILDELLDELDAFDSKKGTPCEEITDGQGLQSGVLLQQRVLSLASKFSSLLL